MNKGKPKEPVKYTILREYRKEYSCKTFVEKIVKTHLKSVH
ncbi:hypothetical protein SAMN02745243_01967 [Hespellia stercorisuis DSM 15480]|uniref:Uncharacterized protein n=1 Tax=Hespellia stercorisuis DSM 15480 TaxID=1121950 RepID=A0A1M6NYA9_9FIRM|nr:hypothetical protein SAMN02745243_01967 [Hespellia stercorisuis DSM 15480]